LPAGQDPNQCLKYNFLDPDKSKAIELGFKAAFLDRRLNIAVAVFKQKFSALFIRGDSAAVTLIGSCVPPYPTQNVQGGCSVGANSTFTFGAPARTKGIDFDSSFRVSDDLNFGALFSWSKGKFSGSGKIPCRDTNLDGIPDAGTAPNNPAAWIAAGGPFGPTLCSAAGKAATFAPPWNATLRGEYSHEIFAGAKGFIRALYNYYPKNKNRLDAVSVDTTPATQRPPRAYGILNLYAGIRAEDGAWEFSVSGRNILNNKTILSRSLDAGTLIAPQSGMHFVSNAAGTFVTSANSGYRTISFVDRREFSISARFAFGSR
jgi:iron complex outermembrane receptor protein